MRATADLVQWVREAAKPDRAVLVPQTGSAARDSGISRSARCAVATLVLKVVDREWRGNPAPPAVGPGLRTQAIAILIDPDRQHAFNIQLNINMPLRCAEPAYDVVVIAADVSQGEVRIEEFWGHEPGFAIW